MKPAVAVPGQPIACCLALKLNDLIGNLTRFRVPDFNGPVDTSFDPSGFVEQVLHRGHNLADVRYPLFTFNSRRMDFLGQDKAPLVLVGFRQVSTIGCAH